MIFATTPHQSRLPRRPRRSIRPVVAALEARRLLSGTTTFDQFLLPDPNADPASIVTGPDGNLWFAANSKIGRVTPTGTLTEFSIPPRADGTHVSPNQLINGPGGDLWFVDPDFTFEIGRITPDGVITEFPLPSAVLDPESIAAGADGNLWFTYAARMGPDYSQSVGRVTPDGTVTLFSTPMTGEHLTNLAAGPDGNLHYLNTTADTIGTITPSGQITEAPLATSPSSPTNLITASDGALWYVSAGTTGGGPLVRIAPDGTTRVFPNAAGATTLQAGADGSVTSFTSPYSPGGQLALVQTTATGATSSTPFPEDETYSAPNSLTVGPDGNLWVTELNAGVIGRFDLNPASPFAPTVVGIGNDPLTLAGYPVQQPLATIRFDASIHVTGATIDWGDGSAPSAGTLQHESAYFDPASTVRDSVTGSHVYTTSGTFQAVVTVTGTNAAGDPVTATIPSAVNVTTPAPVPRAEPFDAGAGIEATNILTTLFQTRLFRTTSGSDFTATIDWGDGTSTTPGTIGPAYAGYTAPFGIASSPDAGDSTADTFGVYGSHTYATAGTYTVHVVITDKKSGSVAVDSTAAVAATPFVLNPVAVTTTKNVVLTNTPPVGNPTSNIMTFTGLDQLTLAGVTDFRANASSAGYHATIDWGDGTAPTAGSFVRDDLIVPVDSASSNARPPLADLAGQHVYTQPGTYSIHYTVTDADGNTVAGMTTATVLAERGGITAAATTPIEVAAGQPSTGLDLGTLSTSDALETAASFTGTIDWGDGSAPSAATFVFSSASGGADQFAILGNHQYAQPGLYAATMRVTTADGSTFVAQQALQATQPTATALAAAPITSSVSPGSTNPLSLATFASPSTLAAPGDFTATIDWGDGSAVVPGIVQADGRDTFGNLQFVVVGSHAYAQAGTFSVQIQVTDATGAASSVTNSIQISDLHPGPCAVLPIITTPNLIATPTATATVSPVVGPISLHFDRVGLPSNFLAGWTLKATKTHRHAVGHHHAAQPVVARHHVPVTTVAARQRVVAAAAAARHPVAVRHGQQHPASHRQLTTHR